MKKQIRKDILRVRQAMDLKETTLKSGLICEKIREMKLLRDADTVMSYIPFRNEVDTCSLFSELWDKGKRVVIPACDVENIALIPSQINSMEDLKPGTWGILEPKPECLRPVDPGEIDLVIVPGVAFDSFGNRLGYGGGYYDRFIPRLKPDTLKIAVAFKMQIVEHLVPGEYDQPMDMVITEEYVYFCDDF